MIKINIISDADLHTFNPIPDPESKMGFIWIQDTKGLKKTSRDTVPLVRIRIRITGKDNCPPHRTQLFVFLLEVEG